MECVVIRSWKHKGLKRFFELGNSSGIQQKHVAAFRLLLFQLAGAIRPRDMNTSGNDFHSLSGDLNGYFSVKVNANWRLIFKFDGADAVEVDYLDYH